MKNIEILNDSARIEALDDMKKMWMWLYKHPAHDKKYYASYVAKLDRPWKNDCPICDLAEQKCSDCLMQWDEQKDTFCTDTESPFRKWQETTTDNPDYRTLYAGEIIALAIAVKGKLIAG
jgi:hypothetical protein